jgi:hypothetical protein
MNVHVQATLLGIGISISIFPKSGGEHRVVHLKAARLGSVF